MNFSSSIFWGSCIALGYLSFLVLMGGQLLDTSRCHLLVFCFPRCAPSHGGFHPVGFVVGAFGSWSVNATVAADGMEWATPGQGDDATTCRRCEIWASETGGGGSGWGGAIHEVGWCFWCWPCFCSFCREFFGMMMNGMIREKKHQPQNMGHFFSNFSTVMPMRFYLDGDVRYLAFFFIGVSFQQQ